MVFNLIQHSIHFVFWNRAVAYQCRLQLAGLDHNHHLRRKQARNMEGEERNHRVYRKRTKRWDAVPVKEKKGYTYVIEIQKKIIDFVSSGSYNTKAAGKSPCGATIAHCDPPSTSELVAAKKSRFK